MKNPPHPGRGIKFDIDALGFSVAEAARALGVTRQQLHNLVSGKSAISAEMAIRLEKGIGSTADAWLALQAAYDLAQVRKRETDIKVEHMVPKAAAE